MKSEFRPIYCDPAIYKGILLTWRPKERGTYRVQLKPDVILYQGSKGVTLKYTAAVKSIQYIDYVTNQTSMLDMQQYARIELTGWNSTGDRVLKLPFKALHKVHFIDFHKKVSGRRAVNSKFLSGVKQPRKVMQISRKVDYQKDPFTLKKSKYRHNTKAFWTKQSDVTRSQGSRVSRYNTLQDLTTDAKWASGYSAKYKILKFVAWKLGMSVNELKLQLLTSHSTQGYPITYFANWFVRCLIHILVLSGFYVNYSSATMSVNQGHILINGQVVSNQHATINVGDLITISPTGWSSIKFSIALSVPNLELLINRQAYSIIIRRLPSVQLDVLSSLNLNQSRSMLGGNLKNPLWSTLLRLVPLISR